MPVGQSLNLSVETAGGIPPITYSWSLNGTVVKSGPEPEFELFADNKAGMYTIGCSAIGANRDLVSCNSEVVVNGIDLKVASFDVRLGGNPDYGTMVDLDDLFVYFGTDYSDYEYTTLDPQPQVPFSTFPSGQKYYLEVSGMTLDGDYQLKAQSKTNPNDFEVVTIKVAVNNKAVYADNPVTVTTSGIVNLNSLFRFVNCEPSEFAIYIRPDYDNTVQIVDGYNSAISIPTGTPTGPIGVTVVATNSDIFLEGAYQAVNNIIVT